MGDTANESLAQRNLVDINVSTDEGPSTLVQVIVETTNVSYPNTSVFCMVLTCYVFVLQFLGGFTPIEI